MIEGIALLGLAMLIGGFLLFCIGGSTHPFNHRGSVMMWIGGIICIVPIAAFILALAFEGIRLIATS